MHDDQDSAKTSPIHIQPSVLERSPRIKAKPQGVANEASTIITGLFQQDKEIDLFNPEFWILQIDQCERH